MPLLGEGPKDLWEHELESLSKAGLIILAKHIYFRLTYFNLRIDRDQTLKDVRECKKFGKWADSQKSFDKWFADPKKAYAAEQRRKKSARAAANRRKREASRAKKEARA